MHAVKKNLWHKNLIIEIIKMSNILQIQYQASEERYGSTFFAQDRIKFFQKAANQRIRSANF